MNTKIAAQIAGLADCNESADHPITGEEREFSIVIGREIAAHHGVPLDEFVAKWRAELAIMDAAHEAYECC